MLDALVYKGSPSGRVVECSVAKPCGDLEPHQVLIKITHSGLCGTDEHYSTQDMVLGHEGVGIVEAIGDAVKGLKVGDRAGWGYCHGSCMTCRECARGQHLYCDKRQLYGMAHLDRGSFASQTLIDDRFLFPIPDGLPSAEAAPLMCAGAAVYSALKTARINWGDRVGVLGVGGLGHLAIQFAAKMGGKAVAISHSAAKKTDAIGFGASEFVSLAELDDTRSIEPLDVLLLSGAQQPDWHAVIPMMRRGGLMIAMTVDPTELRLPYMELVMNGLSIKGSLPTSPPLHREMLEFAVVHKVLPMLQVSPFTEEGINDAMGRLRKNRLRYRAVISREL